MEKERPMTPRTSKCSTCEKAEKGVLVCSVYPDGIPLAYRKKVDGLKDETDKTPECKYYEKEKDPDRWQDPEWKRIIEELQNEP